MISKMIWVPLHNYNDLDGVDVENTISFKEDETAHTIKLINADTDETMFYGLYPDLPKIDKEYYKQQLITEGIVPIIFGSALLELKNVYNVRCNYYSITKLRDVYYGIFELKLDGSEFDLPFGSNFSNTINEYQKKYLNFIGANASEQSTKTVGKKKEGQNKMANLFGDIKVGKAGSRYSLTYFGTVAYDGKTYYQGKIFDATGMTINFDMLYLVPSAEVKKGDIIEKSGKAYYVLDVNNGVVKSVDLVSGTEENLVPGGPFGMTMYSKIFNPMGNMAGENSFGNMLMMQALMGDDNDYGRGNSNNGLLLAMMMMQGGFKFPTFEIPTLSTTSGEKSANNK